MSFELEVFTLDRNYEKPFNIVWGQELAIQSFVREKVYMVNRSIEIERVVKVLTYCLH